MLRRSIDTILTVSFAALLTISISCSKSSSSGSQEETNGSTNSNQENPFIVIMSTNVVDDYVVASYEDPSTSGSFTSEDPPADPNYMQDLSIELALQKGCLNKAMNSFIFLVSGITEDNIAIRIFYRPGENLTLTPDNNGNVRIDFAIPSRILGNPVSFALFCNGKSPPGPPFVSIDDFDDEGNYTGDDSTISDPINVTSTPSEDAVVFTWTKILGATSYLISVKTAENDLDCDAGDAVDTGDVATSTVDSLTPGTAYFYRICSKNDATTSSGFNGNFTTTSFGISIDSFTATTGTSSDGEVDLNFSFSGELGAGETISLRRVVGDTSPTDCNTGTEVTTSIDDMDTNYTDSMTATTHAGKYYHYRLCIKASGGTVIDDSTLVSSVRARGHRAFINSTPQNGNFTNLAGADAACEASALAEPTLAGGTWKAIMSDDTTDASTHITGAGGVYNTNDQIVTATFAALWNAGTVNLTNSVNYEEDGGVTSHGAVNTGTDDDGTISVGNTCSSWSVADGSNVMTGDPTATDGFWLAQAFNICSAATSSFYCISQ